MSKLSNIVNSRKVRSRRELNARNFYGSQLFTFIRLFEMLRFQSVNYFAYDFSLRIINIKNKYKSKILNQSINSHV